MSIHNAFSGNSGAMISRCRMPPEKTRPALMISITSGGKNGFGASVMPMTVNFINPSLV